MKKQLVLIGGGHAHLVTLAHLRTFIDRGFDVTVIQPSEYHYYSGMGPGMLGGTYAPDEIRFATRRLVESGGGRFIQGKAGFIDPDRQIVRIEGTEKEIAYDILSCNAGSFVPREIIAGQGRNVFTAKPIEDLLAARKCIREQATARRITLAVIGGGPSSLEIAGNVHQLCRLQKTIMPRIQIFGGRNFLAGKQEKLRRLARKILERKGIEILENGYVRKIEEGRIILENGQEHLADILFPAVGVKPSPVFARSGLPTGPDGGLLVNEYLQSTGSAALFGGGDCIHFQAEPLDKVGVYAVRQNPVLYRNLMAALEGRQLEKFSPGGRYLLIYNLGDGEGIFSSNAITFAGRLAFLIKDRIDRKFIASFRKA